jgi:hypothetical protein
MRIRRHDRIDLRLRLVDQHLEQRLELGVELGQRIEGPEPSPGRDLVVPAATCMEPPSGLARLLVEQTVDESVHVLIRPDRLFAIGDALPDPVQPLADRRHLVGAKHPGSAESGGPGLGELDIEGPEAEVDGDRPIDRLKLRGRAPGEATTPEFVRRTVRHGGNQI